MSNFFVEKINNRTAKIGVIGLGYVGLPLLIEFSKQGFVVIGFDVDTNKISSLESGNSYIGHINADVIKNQITNNDNATVTKDFSVVSKCDAILICVPTPLNEHRNPDLSYIEKTANLIGPYLRKDQLIVLESTTYPGTTEEVLVPILEQLSGLTAENDFLVGYSPEREDPNNKSYNTSTIPKVVGGLNTKSLIAAKSMYDSIICETVPVSTCRAAEATKLMENIFRCVNIALVNELKMVFSKMDINIWEVINAAKTKPFGYMAFYPGPGLGGHCIPIDPFYLTWKAKEYGISTKFIELAGEINTNMPNYVIQQTMLALNDHGIALKASRVLLVGLAYKKNIDDIRESPTFVLWDELTHKGATVSYLDHFCPEIKKTREHPHLAGNKSIALSNLTSDEFDAAIIATDHDNIDYQKIIKYAKVIIDTRNACPEHEKVYRA